LFASGYAADQAMEPEGEQVLGFIAKPYRPQELVGRVRAALNGGAANAAQGT
jgi:hypothetical protein